MYSNGSNPNIPVSNPATLNAISEDGFMCKPSTATDIDPNTGATYRSEIDAAITVQGFTPLPNLQVEDGQGDADRSVQRDEGGHPEPGVDGRSAGLQVRRLSGGGAPWNFNPVNVDTDNSAVSGTYSNVENGSATLGTQTASASAPIGYCITVTTDGDAGGRSYLLSPVVPTEGRSPGLRVLTRSPEPALRAAQGFTQRPGPLAGSLRVSWQDVVARRRRIRRTEAAGRARGRRRDG